MPVAPAKAMAAVLGIARSTRAPAGKRASMARERDARGDRDDQRVRVELARHLLEHLVDDLRLHRQHDDVGPGQELGSCRVCVLMP